MLDSAATPQPAPSEGVTPVYRMVIADILSRVDAGRAKVSRFFYCIYLTTLRHFEAFFFKLPVDI